MSRFCAGAAIQNQHVSIADLQNWLSCGPSSIDLYGFASVRGVWQFNRPLPHNNHTPEPNYKCHTTLWQQWTDSSFCVRAKIVRLFPISWAFCQLYVDAILSSCTRYKKTQLNQFKWMEANDMVHLLVWWSSKPPPPTLYLENVCVHDCLLEIFFLLIHRK